MSEVVPPKFDLRGSLLAWLRATPGAVGAELSLDSPGVATIRLAHHPLVRRAVPARQPNYSRHVGPPLKRQRANVWRDREHLFTDSEDSDAEDLQNDDEDVVCPACTGVAPRSDYMTAKSLEGDDFAEDDISSQLTAPANSPNGAADSLVDLYSGIPPKANVSL